MKQSVSLLVPPGERIVLTEAGSVVAEIWHPQYVTVDIHLKVPNGWDAEVRPRHEVRPRQETSTNQAGLEYARVSLDEVLSTVRGTPWTSVESRTAAYLLQLACRELLGIVGRAIEPVAPAMVDDSRPDATRAVDRARDELSRLSEPDGDGSVVRALEHTLSAVEWLDEQHDGATGLYAVQSAAQRRLVRNQFAAAALTGLLAQCGQDIGGGGGPSYDLSGPSDSDRQRVIQRIAQRARLISDAMLADLESEPAGAMAEGGVT